MRDPQRNPTPLSGPIVDRLDLQIEVTPLASDELIAAAPSEYS